MAIAAMQYYERGFLSIVEATTLRNELVAGALMRSAQELASEAIALQTSA